MPVLLNSLARAELDQKTDSYSFPKKLPTKVTFDSSNIDAAAKALNVTGESIGVGVDHGEFY